MLADGSCHIFVLPGRVCGTSLAPAKRQTSLQVVTDLRETHWQCRIGVSRPRSPVAPNGGGVDGNGVAAVVRAGKAQHWTRNNHTGHAVVPSQVEVRCVMPQTQ
ncbi:hypothetical protein MPRM_45390 [Mycobacterium parmense]|uniref:Uncharacterized protein n=1 Tax=Mycobacterium parmense TaxID=185642 RepID=A0A7I7YZE1_9MYCO|nr:hypothetical protein MPRM_45390 [Mycobacterium parmense]